MQVAEIDILTGKQGAVIPKPHDLGFCFIATASTHKEFYGLRFAPQTNPASPAVFMYRNSTEEFLCRFDSRDAYFIAPSSFPGLPIFLPRCETWETLETRVYVSIDGQWVIDH